MALLLHLAKRALLLVVNPPDEVAAVCEDAVWAADEAGADWPDRWQQECILLACLDQWECTTR